MDIDQMMYDSLKYPMSSWGKVATLGGILFVTMIIMVVGIVAAIFVNNIIFTVLVAILEIVIGILIAIFYYGYLFKVLKSSLKGKDKLPKFKNFPKLMINGLKVFVVNVAYLLVFVIILLIFNGILYLIGNYAGMNYYDMYSTAAPNSLMIWLYFLVYFVYLLVNMLLSIFFTLIISIAVANMAHKGHFGAAFNFGDIREKIENIRWGKAIVWVLAINVVTTIIMLLGLVSMLLLIGFIVVPLLVVPYLSIFEYRAIALLYKST